MKELNKTKKDPDYYVKLQIIISLYNKVLDTVKYFIVLCYL
jgi:hypothetical protein